MGDSSFVSLFYCCFQLLFIGLFQLFLALLFLRFFFFLALIILLLSFSFIFGDFLEGVFVLGMLSEYLPQFDYYDSIQSCVMKLIFQQGPTFPVGKSELLAELFSYESFSDGCKSWSGTWVQYLKNWAYVYWSALKLPSEAKKWSNSFV